MKIEKLIKKIERKGGVVHSFERTSGLSHLDMPSTTIRVDTSGIKSAKFLHELRKDERINLIEIAFKSKKGFKKGNYSDIYYKKKKKCQRN